MATRSVPQPPFGAEQLADLHADNVTPEQREQLWPAVAENAEALHFLHSLDEVTAALRTLGRDEQVIHPMPADVAARLTRFVEELEPVDSSAEQDASNSRPASELRTEYPQAISNSESVLPPPVSLDQRRGRLRWFTAAAAAIAVLACAGIAVSALRDDTTTSAQPSSPEPTIATNEPDELTTSAAFSALGRHDVAGALANPEAIESCVRANGLDRSVLGSTDITFQGRDAVLILLTGPRPPKITALVVGPGCGAGDPQRRVLRDIG